MIGQENINHKLKTRSFVVASGRAAVLAVLGFALSACASMLDDARSMQTQGTPFQQALHTAYVDQAGVSEREWGDDDGAEFYAARAIEAGKGIDVEPLEAPATASTIKPELDQARGRLTNAFAKGAKQTQPDLTARSQVSYDCFARELAMSAIDSTVYQCKSRFLTLMGRLEVELAPEPVMARASQSEYVVYFGFDEWFLSAEALEVLTAAIDTARSGGHGKIIAAGHTDSSGPDWYNDDLSVRRAEIVKVTLVEMGALEDAVEVIGYGESRLAVQTGDGVREPLNRRTVVTLLP
ncbi:MAG: OmpA family protein [Parvibaculum sp.]